MGQLLALAASLSRRPCVLPARASESASCRCLPREFPLTVGGDTISSFGVYSPTSRAPFRPGSYLHHHHVALGGQLAELVLEIQHGPHQLHDVEVHLVVGPVQVGRGLDGLRRRGRGGLRDMGQCCHHCCSVVGRQLGHQPTRKAYFCAVTVTCPGGASLPSASGAVARQPGSLAKFWWWPHTRTTDRHLALGSRLFVLLR